jgi:hypothetical protein
LLPDDAPWPELAIGAGISAGLAVLQALLAVIIIHFLTMDPGFPVGMETTIHGPSFILWLMADLCLAARFREAGPPPAPSSGGKPLASLRLAETLYPGKPGLAGHQSDILII